ncbi:MAG: tRNA (adenosine(37)-N6)-threonylcarbamoyltransferase complex ATPase subunit type 1 TsaE, partial [Bifidobacterium minimum]|nr:tRNA (adenosine(37)-N6)-threonylcarbamoyltransferase complex ATPase subunit type 1 TsaE [Bifidobacterium minimum]
MPVFERIPDRGSSVGRAVGSVVFADSSASGGSGPSVPSDSSVPSSLSDALVVTARTADGMRRLGGLISSVCRGGDVVLLSGPLGSGKTTFAQGFA